jgi:hypothetical protein
VTRKRLITKDMIGICNINLNSLLRHRAPISNSTLSPRLFISAPLGELTAPSHYRPQMNRNRREPTQNKNKSRKNSVALPPHTHTYTQPNSTRSADGWLRPALYRRLHLVAPSTQGSTTSLSPHWLPPSHNTCAKNPVIVPPRPRLVPPSLVAPKENW